MKRYVSPLFFIPILSFSILFLPQFNFADNSYVDSLITLSHQKELFKERYWKILLHYQDTLFGRKSLVDDPAFFLSKNGKYDPKAELESTLKAFFQQPKEGEKPAICRFIARYTWLKEELDIDDSKVPFGQCDTFNRVMDQIKPKSSTLIFPAEYMNNPASMFGHTLINIETDTKSKLLSHTVNYSAFTGETFGPLYALKGVLGFYKGYYSILPYYEKVQEYSDISQRDIWEFRMNLTEEEVKKMVMHLWELQGIYSYYYFFDENCSYNLLFLLDAARPSLRLTESRGLKVIPIDTVKQIQKKGLIAQVDYRPSKTTRIRYMGSQLSDEYQNHVLRIAKEKIDPEDIVAMDISLENKMRILDMAVELIQYQYTKKEIDREHYTSLFLKTLKVRSRIQASSEELYHIPEPAHPETGHSSNRLGIGFGFRKSAFFEEFRFRPAYHSLLDNDRGYDPGAQIQFLNIDLRHYNEEDRFVLESLDFIDIISVSQRDRFFKPYSWRVKTGLRQKYLGNEKEHLIFNLNTGGGLSYYNSLLGLCYSMIETDLNLGKGLDDSYAIGIGPSIGLKKRMTDIWTILAEVSLVYYFLGDNHSTIKTTFDQNFTVNRNNSVTLECSWNKSFDYEYEEIVMMWNLFF